MKAPSGTAPPVGTAGSAISLEGVRKAFRGKNGEVEALAEVSLSIAHGEFVSLLGPSGCGKSTMLNIMAGLLPASSGSVMVEDHRVTGPQTEMGIVFQRPVLLEWRNALGNVMLQAEGRTMAKPEAMAKARELLAMVGLSEAESKRPSELSGGMQQRVSICRALLHDPKTLIMDEPFGALDALTRDQLNSDLQHMWAQGEKSVVFVTHSVPEAVFLSDRVIVMTPSPGRVALELTIDLPRPRRFAVRETAQFAEYVAAIGEVFTSHGILKEY